MADPRETEVEEEVEETAPETEIEEEEVETEAEGDEPEADAETEAEAEPETERETETQVRTEKPPSRAQRRIQALSEEVRELRKRVEAPPEQRPDPNAIAEMQRREQEEDERVVLSGDPGAIARHFSTKSERRMQGQLNTVIGAVVDSADRTEFRTACAENPSMAAVKDEVERRLQTARAQGLNPKREALAFYILGERMATRGKTAKTRQERRAATETDRQRGRSGTARSDVVAERRRGGKDSQTERAKRLDESGML